MSANAPILEVRNLAKMFLLRKGKKQLQACQDVSFDLARQETLGLVGESGSGKTTLGRCVLRLIEPTSGQVRFEGQDLLALKDDELRSKRAEMQIVFQEALDSFNPSMSVGRQIAEPLRIHTKLSASEREAKVVELLRMVGLPPDVANAYPSVVSAGVLQRCSIARAMATNPKMVVLDEPTSALAPEAEAEVVKLLLRLHEELGISYIWISHNLSLIGEVCQRIAVMYLGQIVEIGPTKAVFDSARHPYSRALVASTLLPDPSMRHQQGKRRKERLQGEIPSPIDLPRGCYLASRCAYALDRCKTEPQSLLPVEEGHLARCWRVVERDLTFDAPVAYATT